MFYIITERGEVMIYFTKEEIRENIRRGCKNLKVREALQFAIDMHKGQFRKDGTLYICHPIRVAYYVSNFKESRELEMLMICAYLHDTVEDTAATYYDIVNRFGPQVASIVLELTTDEDLKNEIGKERYLEIKMKNMTSWALVIKLCDRLDNVSDLKNANESFKKKYSKETIEIIHYLINMRKLSSTHISIIQQIINTLSYLELDREFKERLEILFQKFKCLESDNSDIKSAKLVY